MHSVLLVEQDLNESFLGNFFKSKGLDILKIQYNPLFLSLVKESQPDVVIFNIDSLTEKLIADLHALNQQRPTPIIMFAKDDNNETINKVIKAEVSTYIVDEPTEQRVNTAIQIALARFNHHQVLKSELEEARTQLEDRKQVDRAKAILIKTRNFSEDEAYHTLRKLAMGRNITLGEMARNVIAMADLLK